MILRTEDLYIVGYCPRYWVSDVFDLLSRFPEQLEVLVERVNLPPTPLQFRLLCHLTAECPADFQPFSSSIYQSLSQQEFGAIA